MVRVWWVCTFEQRCYRCVICEVHGASGSKWWLQATPHNLILSEGMTASGSRPKFINEALQQREYSCISDQEYHGRPS
jgi:hypothetical protein